MKLYILRHGHYALNGPELLDLLTEEGVAEINYISQIIAPLNIKVNKIYHSSKSRAKETAELISKTIKSEEPLEERHELQPNEEVAPFLDEIMQWEEDTLIVGHLPFLSRLVSHLVLGRDAREMVQIHTGTMICLERIDIDRWLIKWMISPL